MLLVETRIMTVDKTIQACKLTKDETDHLISSSTNKTPRGYIEGFRTGPTRLSETIVVPSLFVVVRHFILRTTNRAFNLVMVVHSSNP
jgi:hypothetical protein